MNQAFDSLLAELATTAGKGFARSEFRGDTRVVVPAERLTACLTLVKRRGFDYLVDVTAVDYLEYEGATDRFGVVYVLTNTGSGARLVVKTFVNLPNPSLPSVIGLWGAADWLEREVFDLFGIRFEGHPDLRRLLMPDGFIDHPLRKDYPLKGLGERHNFPVVTRAES
ncbi:MAG: NADH-quinone oxidoreductase subunit C [Lacipirellulaceae bacterium]